MSEQQWYCPNCGPEISVTVERIHIQGRTIITIVCTGCGETVDEKAETPAFVLALQQRIATLEAAISEMTTDPCGEYYTGLRCGVEDRDIVCRYEAAEYGWQQAFEYIGSIAAGYLVEG